MASKLKHLPSGFSAPLWANWLAQDKSGVWWAFEQEPNEGHNFWYENEVGRCLKVTQAEPNMDWRNTLQRI